MALNDLIMSVNDLLNKTPGGAGWDPKLNIMSTRSPQKLPQYDKNLKKQTSTKMNTAVNIKLLKLQEN